MLNIDCDTMMSCLDKNNKHFAYRYQNIMIVKVLHKYFGEMYLRGKKIIRFDELFIITNIRIYCQMDVAEFEALLYTTLSEEPFKNQRINIKDEKDDYLSL